MYFEYNALDERYTKNDWGQIYGSSINYYIFDDSTKIHVRRGLLGPTTIRFVAKKDNIHISELVNYIDASLGSVYHLTKNHIGSILALSDINQNIAQDILFDSFGNILQGDIIEPYIFQGKEYLNQLGGYNYFYRDYLSGIGRCLVPDPIIKPDFHSFKLNRIISNYYSIESLFKTHRDKYNIDYLIIMSNHYSLFDNNPLNNFDYLGLESKTPWDFQKMTLQQWITTVTDWAKAAPEKPGAISLSLALIDAALLTVSLKIFGVKKSDKWKHCYIGCMLRLLKHSRETVEYVAWFKEWVDLTQSQGVFEKADCRATIYGINCYETYIDPDRVFKELCMSCTDCCDKTVK